MMTNNKNHSLGAITFRSDDEALNAGFEWAKDQALFYAHHGEDPVGLWYEAALPGREAFCMRDVSHQSLGAAVLGLQAHTRNMMLKFAENISETRDYCTYWEITGGDIPAPVDYENDQDFWYNLPANFDAIDACYRQYLWTGDRSYLDNPVFRKFYDLSVTEYVKTWDKDGDGILEYEAAYGRRGLASYNEAGEYARIGADLIAIMIAGYEAYAEIVKLTGQGEARAAEYSAKASELRKRLEEQWWDESNGCFYIALSQKGDFIASEAGEGQFLPLYYGVIDNAEKREGALREAIARGASNVEGMSYLPETYYRGGSDEEALRSLKALMEPSLERREYPEVSYSAVGAVVSGLMGISADGISGVTTESKLAGELTWAELSLVPVLGRTIAVKHQGTTHTEFSNLSGAALRWKAKFRTEAAEGQTAGLNHNGLAIQPSVERDELGRTYLVAEVEVEPGETHTITVG
ncbi:MGH1-like glycoside hydrolase domain-containing protein [Paenibacillus radicis (ex Gao et al. 2016)]|uniref:Mannosylglycerate hydrolase MGH1-like glycoside hydrolase domain-containing protein n=1 Tax=Paenibacillus radicis (ex Gao et al. 2016) TaxID=1737354 RepID=A0A917LY79_9BACL|nr:hypothetical protein [Paenibacillus radicis (ex Gao et al. 2016)]GGG65058.1 hypothetical protein GCM10010918_18970 [Paenibacillus radicis (ex Gao et al. 2016)]